MSTPEPARPSKPVLLRQATADCFQLSKSKENRKKPLEKVSLSSEVHNALRVMWSGKWAVATPYALVFAVWRFLPQFRSYQQQDAQEFLNGFVDALLAEAAKVLDEAKSALGMEKGRASPMPVPVTPSLLTSSPNSVSIVRQFYSDAKKFKLKAFSGQTLSAITCDVCGTVSSRGEGFLTLPLMVPLDCRGKSQANPRLRRSSFASAQRRQNAKHAGAKSSSRARQRRGRVGPVKSSCSVDDMLNHYCSTERLEGDSKYHCDQCAAKCDATKRICIEVLPEVLVLHINRASWGRGKLMDHVKFPLSNFHMEQYSISSQHRDGDEDSSVDSTAVFDLVGVVNHHGRAINQGHYSAFCRDSDEETWLLFNDKEVSMAAPEEVLASQAYLLFYERKR